MKATRNKEELEKTVKVMQEASENIRKTFQNLIPRIPQIKIPEFKIPDISKIESPDVMKEKNNWERHSELMEVQDGFLRVQGEILKEQKSTSKMTLVILILTICAIFIAVISLLKSFEII